MAANEDARDELAYKKLTGQSLDARGTRLSPLSTDSSTSFLAPSVSKEQRDFVAALEEAKRLFARSKIR